MTNSSAIALTETNTGNILVLLFGINRQAEMFVKKDYSIIAPAGSFKRGGDQRKARFESSLSGMTLELMPQAHGLAGAAIPSVAFARDLEVGS